MNIPATQFSDKRQELYNVVGIYFTFRNVNNALIMLTNILLPCYRNTANAPIFGGLQGVLYIGTGGAIGNIILNWYLLKKAKLLSPFFSLSDERLMRRLELIWRCETVMTLFTVVVGLLLYAAGFPQGSYFFQGIVLLVVGVMKVLYCIITTSLFLRPVRRQLALLRSQQQHSKQSDAIVHNRVLQIGPGPDALGVGSIGRIPLLGWNSTGGDVGAHPGQRGGMAMAVGISTSTENEAVVHSVVGGILAVGSSVAAYSLYSYCLLNGLGSDARNSAWSYPLNPWLVLSIDFVANDVGMLLISGICQNLKHVYFLSTELPQLGISLYNSSSNTTNGLRSLSNASLSDTDDVLGHTQDSWETPTNSRGVGTNGHDAEDASGHDAEVDIEKVHGEHH